MERIALLWILWTLFPSAGIAETWTPVSSGTSQRINALFFVSPDTGWIAGENTVIRKTVDGGATWTAQSGSGTIKSIKFANSKVGWAVGESAGAGVALKTTDGGATWVHLIDSGPVLWDVQIANGDPDHVWIAGAGGFLRQTTDGGVTWTLEIPGSSWGLPTSGTQLDLHRMWLHTDGSLWLVVGADGLIRRLAVNEGDSLSTVASHTTNDLYDMDFPKNRFGQWDSGWCVGTQGTILRSTDAGLTWTAQNSGVTADLYAVTFATPRAGYAAGVNGVLLRTTDAGENWVAVNSGTANAIRDAGVNVGAGGWIAGDLGTVLKQTAVQPLALTYIYPTYTVGFTIKPVVPKILASGPVRFSVDPPLPEGLLLDTNTGIVTGTPTTVMSQTSYSITATNDLGSITAPMWITVLKASTLTYSDFAPQYTVGIPIVVNHATLVRPGMTWDRWEVTPALPAGLKLDTMPNGGSITGTPTQASPSKDYLVTAIISNGTWVSVTLNITVVAPASVAGHSGETVFGFTLPGGASLRLEVPRAAVAAHLRVLAQDGRTVWESVFSSLSGMAWEGAGFDGRRIPAGVYTARFVWVDSNGREVGTVARHIPLLP